MQLETELAGPRGAFGAPPPIVAPAHRKLTHHKPSPLCTDPSIEPHNPDQLEADLEFKLLILSL
jgi:hypothetical protein